MTRRLRVGLIALIMLVAVLAVPQPARADIYWGDPGWSCEQAEGIVYGQPGSYVSYEYLGEWWFAGWPVSAFTIIWGGTPIMSGVCYG